MITVMFWIWLGIGILALVIESSTMALVSIWFFGGAIVSMLVSLIPAFYWPWQVVVFIVVSSILLLCFRKLAGKVLFKKSDGKTNMSLAIGKKIKILSDANEDKLGTAKFNGIIWSVKEENNEELKTGESVEVVKISGNKLIVKKFKEDKKAK